MRYGAFTVIQKSIYIPLWSYSNLFYFLICFSCYLFTFHYGPIQMIFFRIFLFCTLLFTFHYGPIQIELTFHQLRISKIYIPLWSYSNTLIILCMNLILNLHSTMVLFKYSNYLFYNRIFKIYIPLWSYSNGKRSATLDVSYLFTFHYGPIQIVKSQFDTKFSFIFTFHYGPIQIRCYCNTIIV